MENALQVCFNTTQHEDSSINVLKHREPYVRFNMLEEHIMSPFRHTRDIVDFSTNLSSMLRNVLIAVETN